MQRQLLIVESPTKAKTIKKFLGNSVDVVATVGHLRDLPSNKMGVDMKTWDLEYVFDPKKKDVVKDIAKRAQSAKEVFLASDPDREGEAIAWHVQFLINGNKKAIKRVVFHEITKEAIEEALKNKREIDMNLVNAQQGRRVLDRVVGYSLSPVLWKKVRRGLSAGRVQSVAVRLIVERDKEIEKFNREKYFKIFGDLEKQVTCELDKIAGKKFYFQKKLDLFDGEYNYSVSLINKKEKADDLLKSLSDKMKIEKVNGREVSRAPLPAFTTSKLQQAASRKFGWTGKQTMSIAQKLYEKGVITYHRTDSVYLSSKAIEEFRNYIEKNYGEKYLVPKIRFYKNTAKNAQEAHEAIRPTSAFNLAPAEADPRELKLYELIWKRAVATQGAVAKMMNTTINFANGQAEFVTKGTRMLFDGFLKITNEKHEDCLLPDWKEGELVKVDKFRVEETETQAPPRYTDASLVSSLEKQGIGRPSTYAPIISTILLRQYVDRDEGRFKSTSLGQAVSEFLVTNFLKIVTLPFTAEMEEDLDQISLGKLDWKMMMKSFWREFEKDIKKAEKDSERVKIETESLGRPCPDCGADLIIRLGRFGKFIACSKFPECKHTEQFKEMAGFNCPTCGAEGVVRKTKTGRKFYGCSKYPNCKWAGWKKP